MSNLTFNGMTFDSLDEIWAYHYFTECYEHDLIEGFVYHPPSIEIFPPVKHKEIVTVKKHGKFVDVEKESTLLRECSYTPDFVLYDIDKRLVPYFRESKKGIYYVDVKPKFARFHDDKQFSIICKAIYYVHKIYVNKMICPDLFKKTFCPKACFYTEKTNKVRKMFENLITVEKFNAKKD